MVGQYSWWNYLIIAVVLIFSALYALPNLYGVDPSLQISASREAKIDQATTSQVQGLLDQAGIKFTSLEQRQDKLLIRFDNTDSQLRAQELVKQGLGAAYVAALNLTPATPSWLQFIGAKPINLGLDLRGGVHFLMEVDMAAVLKQRQESYMGDLRVLLRNNKLNYLAVSPEGEGIAVTFREADNRNAASKLITKEYPELVLRERDEAGSVLLATMSEQALIEARRLAVQQNITTLRNRINQLGVAEPIVQQQGLNRIVVQLPGVQDAAQARNILGATATLEFRLVDEEHDVQEAVAGRVPAGAGLYRERNGNPVLLKKQIIVTGENVSDAKSGIDPTDGSPAVFITLDSKGARSMQNVTQDNVGKLMSVVFIETHSSEKVVEGQVTRVRDTTQEVISIARIREALSKSFQITGLDSPQEARDLALLLRAGALSAPMDIIEERTVGPSLGQANINQGVYAALVGFLLVVVFMAVYYRVFGIVANIALVLNVVILVALLSILPTTLTLPGIAGILLTVGMAVDANVLINERIREELRSGNTPQASIHAGYERAFGTIIDSNITTLIAAAVLFGLGSGPVKGFAVTLSLGILTSMFTAIMVSRGTVNLLYGRRKVTKLSIG